MSIAIVKRCGIGLSLVGLLTFIDAIGQCGSCDIPAMPVADRLSGGVKYLILKDYPATAQWSNFGAAFDAAFSAWNSLETSAMPDLDMYSGDNFVTVSVKSYAEFSQEEGDGSINNGTELFGDRTAQPSSLSPNGFLALGVYDAEESGGDGDGWITAADEIFQWLMLWTDWNHDGVSQPEELRAVHTTTIIGFDLHYRESRRRDRHGNLFRYITVVELDPSARGQRRKFAVDVFFRVQP